MIWIMKETEEKKKRRGRERKKSYWKHALKTLDNFEKLSL